jgi:hypothetical protein
MHAVMAHILSNRRQNFNDTTPRTYGGYAVGLAGQTFHDRALTVGHLDSMILPALDHLKALEQAYGSGFRVASVEKRVKFKDVPGAFGTVDLTLINDSYIVHVDWKFGQGVGVQATYDDGAGELVNPQLMFYACAYLHTTPALYTRRKVVLAIIQPRTDERLTHTEVSRTELKTFADDVRLAVIAAIGRDPPIRKGEWCRFAPCKVSCPLWAGPALELAALQPAKREDEVKRDQVTPFGEYLSNAKRLVDILGIFKEAIDAQLHAYLENGGTVPGWRLKAKTKQRQWVDPEIVTTELAKIGFQHDEIWTKKLATFAATDAVAKRRGVKIPDNLRVMPATTETTVAPDGDPAPVVQPTAVLVEQFQQSLLALRKQPLWIETKQAGAR